MASIRPDIRARNDQDGGWCDVQLHAEAALKGIEWFGLRELYDAYLPENFGLEKAS